MKRLFSSLLCTALVLCLLTFAGCGTAGRYVFKELSYDGFSVDAGEAMKGDPYYIELNANGTAILCIDGESIQMEWDDAHIWAAGEEDAKADLQIEGDEVTITIEDTKMIFEKD